MSDRFHDMPMFDADNHIYEPLEALTEYLPEKHRNKVQLVQIGRRSRIALRGEITDYMPNPTFEVVAAPGSHADFYAGKNPDGLTLREMAGKPIRLEDSMRWPEQRLALMDAQRLERTIMFPTLANLVEYHVADDPNLTHDVLHALNEWLHNVWTFNLKDRVYSAAAITCALVDRAIEELEWALERGAKVILMRPSPVIGYEGSRAFSGTEFDPFWARVEEAGIGVCLHGTQPITSKYAEWWDPRESENAFTTGAYRYLLLGHRDIQDTIAGLICQGTLTRFPKLRIASVENGADWVPSFLENLSHTKRKYPQEFPEDPIEVFRRNIWVSPFWEENLLELVELCGEERVVFGSDWPHPEGLAEPRSYFDYVEGLNDSLVRRIVHDNADALVGV
jgi:predicted TIM-barrel fold metal-dependent hydrolase